VKNLKILRSFLPQDDTATINSFHINDTELDFFSGLTSVHQSPVTNKMEAL